MFSNACALFVVLGCLGASHLIQPVPVHTDSGTVIYRMRNELSSPWGNCSFPPSDVLSMVLNSQEEERFLFLQKCNVKPTQNDGDLLLCMTLFDIGLNLCSANEKNYFDRVTRHLPRNSSDFQTMMDRKEELPTEVCQELQTFLEEPTMVQTKHWNLKSAFSRSEDACDRICYDFQHEEKTICKAILWGSKLLKNARSGPEREVESRGDSTRDAIPVREESVGPPVAGGDIAKTPPTGGDNARSDQRDRTVARPNADYGPTSDARSSPVGSSSNSQSPVSRTQHMHAAMVESGRASSSGKHRLQSQATADADGVERTSQQETDRKKNSSPVSGQSRETPPSRVASMETQPDLSVDKVKPDSDVNIAKPDSDVNIAKQDSDVNIAKPDSDVNIAKPDSDVNVAKQDSDVNIAKPDNNVVNIGNHVRPTGSSSTEKVPDIVDDAAQIQETPDSDAQDFNNDGLVDPDDDDQHLPIVGVESPEKSDVFETQHGMKISSEADDPSNGNPYRREKFDESEESHFFSYFTTLVLLSIIGYLVFHNKQKILALVLEGRSRRNNRRRPNTANYHKLDCNLEEAVSSPCNTSSTHVIY